MKPETVILPQQYVAGLSVRTRTCDERAPETARIKPLWARFWSENMSATIPGCVPETPPIGVYSNYDTGTDGFYDVTVGVGVADPVEGCDTVLIHEGKYLVFKANGAMPDAILATWEEVWRYCAANAGVKRRFLTDFEVYDGPHTASVYIGIE